MRQIHALSIYDYSKRPRVMGSFCHLFPAKKQLVHIHQRLHPLQVDRHWFKSSVWSLTWKQMEVACRFNHWYPNSSRIPEYLESECKIYFVYHPCFEWSNKLTLFRFTWVHLSRKFTDKNRFVITKLEDSIFFITRKK